MLKLITGTNKTIAGIEECLTNCETKLVHTVDLEAIDTMLNMQEEYMERVNSDLYDDESGIVINYREIDPIFNMNLMNSRRKTLG